LTALKHPEPPRSEIALPSPLCTTIKPASPVPLSTAALPSLAASHSFCLRAILPSRPFRHQGPALARLLRRLRPLLGTPITSSQTPQSRPWSALDHGFEFRETTGPRPKVKHAKMREAMGFGRNLYFSSLGRSEVDIKALSAEPQARLATDFSRTIYMRLACVLMLGAFVMMTTAPQRTETER
jgi:hypothetical protein